MYAVHNRSPSYLSDTVQTVATATTRCGLRSSATTDYVVPCTLPKFGERALAYAGPSASNHLPQHIRCQSTPATFRRHLKTILFAKVFNTTWTLNNCNMSADFWLSTQLVLNYLKWLMIGLLPYVMLILLMLSILIYPRHLILWVITK